ncbi:unnamed protein product [Brassica oleracea var. botrytis]|uniref:Uncharacterized protein n=1 Tax=Brassica oleracea var. oleracea TaxID=109376 RepID=A0A0D2ZSY3_BRAOL
MVVIVVITSSASELKEWKRHMVHSRLDAPDDLHLPLLPLQRVIIWLSNEEEFWSAFEDESAICGDSQVRGYPFKVVQNHASVVINRAINIFSSRGINPQRRSGSRKQPSQLSTVVNEPSLPPPNTDPSPESLGAAASRPLRQELRGFSREGLYKRRLSGLFDSGCADWVVVKSKRTGSS